MKPRGQALDKRLRTTFMERAQSRTKGSSLNDRDRWLEVGPEDRAGRASSASGPGRAYRLGVPDECATNAVPARGQRESQKL